MLRIFFFYCAHTGMTMLMVSKLNTCLYTQYVASHITSLKASIVFVFVADAGGPADQGEDTDQQPNPGRRKPGSAA